MISMFKLSCAGKLGNCPKTVNRFRFTCLFCRWRRSYYNKFVEPPFYIKYTYKSLFREEIVTRIVLDGLEFRRRDGGKLKHKIFQYVTIDPRGHFTYLRCAAIMVLDNIMKAFSIGKPLVELCEFLANYPTW